ncbi:hypothetical protein ACHAPA_009802 [Fusarium lateritium]
MAPASKGGIATVIIQSPQPYTTVTSYGPFTAASTTTMAPAYQGGMATVVVDLPQPYTTTTSWGSFSTVGTTTLSPTSPGGVATVVMQKPQPYTTVTTYTTVSSISTSTGTPASAGQTATVVIIAPAVGTKAADQTCSNAGLEYAIYANSFYNADPPNYSALNATYFGTATPTYTGITSAIGITEPGGVKAGNSGPAQVIYPGSPSQTWQYKAVNHRAFLYAPINGTYTVNVPYSDEITLVWFGNKALSTWTRANADLEQGYSYGPSSAKTLNMQLTAGTYTPFRVFWANAQGDYSMIVTVTAPDGTVIVNGSGSSSKYFVRFACDSSTPTYPAFGRGG